MSGWIKLHRQMLEWEWYDDINVMRLFTHCLLRANHKDKQWRGIDIKRGQFYTSLDTLSDETGLSAMQLRTCFSKLKVTGEITSSGMARGRMITVVQYDEYQDDNKQSDRVATGLQQAGNRVATTNKNDKNEKKVNNIDFSVFNMTDDQVNEVKRIRRHNKGGSITQRVANGLAKEFSLAISQGHTIDSLLTEWETRGWKSFKAEWVKNEVNNRSSQPKQSLAERTADQARAIHAQCEAEEANERAMGADGSIVSQQVEFIGRGDA